MCTRTPMRHANAASADTNAVAVSRPSGGRAAPVGAAKKLPRKTMRDASDQPMGCHWSPIRQRVKQGPIILTGLGASQPGRDQP